MRGALVAFALVVVASGCGSDSDDASSDSDATTTTAAAAEAEPTELTLTMTDDGLEGLPEEVPAGLVSIEVTDDTTDGGAGGEIDFSLVEDGTTVDDFTAGIVPILAGGPFPDFMLNNTGAVESSTTVLAEGDYMVWFNTASNTEREATADDIVATALTVGSGEADAELPEADGTVSTTDYQFEVDVPAGEATVNVSNDSTEQYHHVILVDFGTNDPEVIEENITAIISSEDGSLPEGVDGSQIDFEGAATSPVYGPGSGGTMATDLTKGNTYVALCFISDVSGGAPHAIQHDMHQVFTAE